MKKKKGPAGLGREGRPRTEFGLNGLVLPRPIDLGDPTVKRVNVSLTL